MFDLYEGLPEWVRWVLFLPVFVAITFLFGWFFHIQNFDMADAYLFKYVFAPAVMNFFVVCLFAGLIPRGKIASAYVLCFLYFLMVLLIIGGWFILPQPQGGKLLYEGVQSVCCFLGSIFAVLFIRKKGHQQLIENAKKNNF